MRTDCSGEGVLWPSERQRLARGRRSGCGLLEQLSLYFAPAGNMSSHKGLNGTCSVHEYSGTFAGQPVRFKMTSVCGHVMTLDFLGEPPSPCPPPHPAEGSLAKWCHGSSWSQGRAPGREACAEPVSPEASRSRRGAPESLGEVSRIQVLELSAPWVPIPEIPLSHCMPCAPSCASWRWWLPTSGVPGPCSRLGGGSC